jgi:hypothetical protein
VFVTVIHHINDPEGFRQPRPRHSKVEGAVGAWATNESFEMHVDALTPQLGK